MDCGGITNISARHVRAVQSKVVACDTVIKNLGTIGSLPLLSPTKARKPLEVGLNLGLSEEIFVDEFCYVV